MIDGAVRCPVISTARSRAAATTNLARSNQSLFLRVLFAWAKSCALVNLFMLCPPMVGWSLSYHDEILHLITAISWRRWARLARRASGLEGAN